MLQFLKKTSKHGHHNHQQKYIINENTASMYKYEENKTHIPLSTYEDEVLYDLNELNSRDNNNKEQQSRLSRCLSDVLGDKNALGYFMRFLESRNAARFLLCLLDIETYKLGLDSVKKRAEHDSLSVSTRTSDESISICDYSNALTESDNNNTDLNSICDNSNEINRALDIFKKYVALESDYNVNCDEGMRKEVVENICNVDKVVSVDCFDSVYKYVYNVLRDDYFDAFIDSDYFCKYQIDLLTCGNVVLNDILYNETVLFYFMEYLEQENCRCLLEFWMAGTNFQQQLIEQKEFFDGVEAQNDAVVLYDKYFSLQATSPLGFSDKVRFAVEESICGENGLSPDCFQLPLKIIERVLDKNYLKSFLDSQLFYKYLSDLINTVQTNYGNVEKCKSRSSDCGSELSYGQSAFLACELPHDKNRERTGDMTIDTRALYDPDSLWKRKKCNRLSLGRVNELGKYETDFEPEPDRKQFKFKDVLRKVMSTEDEDRKREEMAWQVAELIVKDITNVTLGPRSNLNQNL